MGKSYIKAIHVIMLLALTGCGLLPPEPQKLYQGPDLPLDQIASIAFGGGGMLNVQSIDSTEIIAVGKTHKPTKGLHITPGTHTVTLSYSNLEGLESGGVGTIAIFAGAKKEIVFEAKAGHSYIPRVERVGGTVKFWIEDKGEFYSPECMTESAYAQAYLVGTPLPGC